VIDVSPESGEREFKLSRRVGSEARTAEDSALGARIISAFSSMLLSAYMLSIILMFECRFWTLSSYIRLTNRRRQGSENLTPPTIIEHSEGRTLLETGM